MTEEVIGCILRNQLALMEGIEVLLTRGLPVNVSIPAFYEQREETRRWLQLPQYCEVRSMEK